jgi:DNA-binding XRE family transcriptional regulator
VLPAQLRAARALVDWSRKELAARASISPATVKNIEYGKVQPNRATAESIRRSLEAAGVSFLAWNTGSLLFGVAAFRPLMRAFRSVATTTCR